MITSAGCNALDYVLSGPARIDCVDLNPHQTALLDLKLAAIRNLAFPEFFAMFGEGKIDGHFDVYRRKLRPSLRFASRSIWDKRIRYFDSKGRGFYFHGTSGLFARAIHWRLRRQPRLEQDLQHIQSLQDLRQQAEFYRSRIAPQLWSSTLRWMLRRRITMSFLGVPDEQIREIRTTAKMDLSAFTQTRVDRVFTELSLQNNYFWRLYMNGKYSRECCPLYLRAENFDRLRELCDRIHPHTMSLTDFLQFSDARFSIYVLLDHMDWLASSEELLQNEWKAILKTALPHARIIYRSGGTSFDHVPEFARSRMEFRHDIASALHQRDRVGTYGSFYLASLKA